MKKKNFKRSKNTEREFLAEMEKRLDENRRLSAHGGVPQSLAPVISVFGQHVWQMLLFGSFVVSSLLFLVFPLEFLGLVKKLLLL
jgi:hypothetical protein